MNSTKEKFWLDHLNAWRKSDLSNAAYCSAHNLDVKLFSSWKTKLYRSHPELKNKTFEIPVFLPVGVVKSELVEHTSGIYIHLANELKISLERNFDETTLSRVIAIVNKKNV